MAYNKDDPKSLILISKSMQKQEQILQSIQQSQKEIDASLAIMAKKSGAKKVDHTLPVQACMLMPRREGRTA